MCCSKPLHRGTSCSTCWECSQQPSDASLFRDSLNGRWPPWPSQGWPSQGCTHPVTEGSKDESPTGHLQQGVLVPGILMGSTKVIRPAWPMSSLELDLDLSLSSPASFSSPPQHWFQESAAWRTQHRIIMLWEKCPLNNSNRKYKIANSKILNEFHKEN